MRKLLKFAMMQRRRNGEVHAAATIRMGPSYGLSKDGRAKRKAAAPPEPTIEVSAHATVQLIASQDVLQGSGGKDLAASHGNFRRTLNEHICL